MADWDTIWINTNLATMAVTGNSYGQIKNGAIAIKNSRIAWIGLMETLPGKPEALASNVIDATGKWITPGLIDCHTHLVFGGSRVGEFEQRLQGVSYEEISQNGGGIISTMAATRVRARTNQKHRPGHPFLRSSPARPAP